VSGFEELCVDTSLILPWGVSGNRDGENELDVS